MSVSQAADSGYVVGITDEWLPGAVFSRNRQKNVQGVQSQLFWRRGQTKGLRNLRVDFSDVTRKKVSVSEAGETLC